LRLRLSRFAKDFQQTKIGNLSAAVIDEWLTALSVAPGTRNTFRRDLRTLFSFCERRGYCQTNEAKKTERAKDVDKPAGILTVTNAAALLDASDNATLPYVAISLFAGLRAAEVQKLDWSEIDFESGHIEVTAAKSKTAKRRLVPISENLARWIRPFARISGPVVSEPLRSRFDRCRRSAGFGPPGTETADEKKLGLKLARWPQNAMRHSYGSYRLAQCHDAARVSLEMGNSTQMVFAHYREIVRARDSERYWKLAPTFSSSQKIVSIAH
jgi:integrase